MEREAWIIDAVRSPRGKGKESGALHQVHPQRILAQVLNALQQRNGFDTREVDDVVMGCGAGSGDHSMDIARMAALDAGWSIEAPGVTLNRFCGSGQQAVNFAAMGVLSGFQDLVVAGGVESMSRPAPMHVDGFTANNRHLRDQYDMVPQGISADLIATTEGFTREQCDQLGVDSQNRAQAAIAEGRFDKSLVPIFHDDGTLALDHEEFPRPGTTLADLAKLAPSFAGMGSHVLPDRGKSIDEIARLAYPHIDAIEHELVRECLRITGITKRVEISTMGDIPSSGSGLGSSSTVTVGDSLPATQRCTLSGAMLMPCGELGIGT